MMMTAPSDLSHSLQAGAKEIKHAWAFYKTKNTIIIAIKEKNAQAAIIDNIQILMAPNYFAGLDSKMQGLCSDPTTNHLITAPPSVGQICVCVQRWCADEDIWTPIHLKGQTKKQELKKGRKEEKEEEANRCFKQK